ncbi:MAG: endonuclease/exonuclease/phosphatase family protein [Kiritimatiellia bacterium]
MTDNFKIFLHGSADAGAFLGVLFTIAGLFDRFSFFLEFFTHLRLVLLVCFTGYIILKLLLKCYKTAFLCIIPLLINAIPPMLLFVPQNAQKTPGKTTQITILQANVLSSNRNSDRLLELVEKLSPEIIVLQEINRHWLKELSILKKEYPVFAEHPREDNFGAAIFCRTADASASIEFLNDPDMLPLSTVSLKKCGRKLTVRGLHPLAPVTPYHWKWRNTYMLELAEKLDECEGPVILTGDFNNTPWTYHYRQFIKKSGLLDSSQGRGPLPTWPASTAILPLDHCLHSKNVIITTRKRGPHIGSDHYPLIITAQF